MHGQRKNFALLFLLRVASQGNARSRSTARGPYSDVKFKQDRKRSDMMSASEEGCGKAVVVREVARIF